MPKFSKNLARVERAFSREGLAAICAMSEYDFERAFDLEVHHVQQDAPQDFYYFKDHGSSVLAVAHLDTVVHAHQREAHFIDTAGGPVVYSGALDDRLGAYIILDLLPTLGIQYDILLTTGEEMGMSTGAFFEPPPGKEYDWIIEFDRGGTDVVMYDYEDDDTIAAVRRTGARVGDGIFSDISYMEHLGVKGWNWGVGYQDYHSVRSHAYLDDTMEMVARFLNFHHFNEGVYWPHTQKPKTPWWAARYSWDWDKSSWADDDMRYDPTDEDLRELEEKGYDEPNPGDFDFYDEHPSLAAIQAYDERLEREEEMRLATRA